MPLDLQEFNRLKREAETARRKADEAAGMAKAAQERLASLGLKSVAAAEKRLAVLDREIGELEQEFADGLVKYREKYQ